VRCGTCGGGLASHSRQHGGRRAYFYGCTFFWKRGAKVCPNNLVAQLDVLDNEVLATLKDDVFRASVIEEAIRLALAELAPARRDTQRRDLESELASIRRECGRLAAAIGSGGPLDALVARLADRQARQTTFEADLRPMAVTRSLVDVGGLEARLRGKLDDWRGSTHRRPAKRCGRCSWGCYGSPQ
jgi:hypothetical protein